MIARSAALVLAIIGLAACAARIASQRTAPCTEGRWSEPQQMMVGTKGFVYVESPQAVATRSGTVFFGDNSVVWTVSDTGFGRIAGWMRGPGMIAGVIRRADGRFEPVPLPYHLRSFMAVRAVGDRLGNAHVFWGDSPDTTINQSRHLRGLTYAVFDGTSWSEPVSVVRDSTLLWDPVYSSIIALGDTVHLVVPADDMREMLHVTRTPDGKLVVRRHPFAASYTSLTTAGDGSLLLAYIHGGRGGSRQAPPDRTVISVVRSADGGSTWSEPVAIHRSGTAGSYAIRLIHARATLYAVWESSPPVTPSPATMFGMRMDIHDSIQAAVSHDGGQTWSRVPGLSTASGAGGLEAARGPDDAVHVIYQSGWGDSVRAITVASLRDDRWISPVPVGTGVIWPTLNRLGDSLFLSWDKWHIIGPEHVLFTQLSTYACSQPRSPH